MLANDDFALLGNILSEVKTFWREHNWAYRLLEVFVWYDSVTVQVESLENILEFLVWNGDAPEV